SPIKPGEIESNTEKTVSNYNKALTLPKIKAKTHVDGLDDAEEFENLWVELKGGFGNYHETENENNREDLDVLFKGFSTMSAMQELTLPEETKKKIGGLEFFGIRGIGNHFQFWGSLQENFDYHRLKEEKVVAFRIYSMQSEWFTHSRYTTRVEISRLNFHQIKALAISKRVFEADSSPIKAKRVQE
ncbi:11896_t:CDS:2, partial [Entrophospora sp. SA101]